MGLVCRGVRGATTVDSNDREAILEATRDLLRRLVLANGIRPEDVASVIFSTTPDLNAEFPAVAARQLGWHDVALFCTHEMNVPGALRRCIRVLIHWNTERAQDEIHHVYIRGARHLRPDRAVEFSPPSPEDEVLDAAPSGPLVLALDAHAGGYTTVIGATNGEVLAHYCSTSSLFLPSGRLVLSRLYDALDAALLEARPRPLRPKSLSAVVLSLDAREPEPLREALRERYGWDEEIRVVDRLTAAHAAAGCPAPAVVLLADARWSALGVDAAGRHQPAPFAGSEAPLSLADRPTSAWLGHRGFEAAISSQLTGPPTPLLDLLLAHTGTASAPELLRLAQGQAGPAFWAALAEPVATAAHRGDEVALRLLDEAGRALGEAGRLLAHLLGLQGDALTVVVAGALADLHPALLRRAGETLQTTLAEAELVPVPHVVAGTLRLALEHMGGPSFRWDHLVRAISAGTGRRSRS